MRGARSVEIEEYQSCCESFAERYACFVRERAQPRIGSIQKNSATVAGDAVGVDAAAMRHLRQSGERLIYAPRARLRANACDKAEATAVVLVARVVQTRCCAMRHCNSIRRRNGIRPTAHAGLVRYVGRDCTRSQLMRRVKEKI